MVVAGWQAVGAWVVGACWSSAGLAGDWLVVGVVVVVIGEVDIIHWHGVSDHDDNDHHHLIIPSTFFLVIAHGRLSCGIMGGGGVKALELLVRWMRTRFSG